MTKTVLLLCGGKSSEHEISLLSAKGILDALDRKRYTPQVVGISKSGVWHWEDEKSFFLGDFRADKIRLNESGPRVWIEPYLTEGRGHLRCEEKRVAFDVVFPMLHGRFGEDGTLQGLLEMVGIPYVGSDCASSSLCMDKILTKTLCNRAGIRSAPFVSLSAPGELKTQKAAISQLGFPLFVKPPREGSSIGVSRVETEGELTAAVEQAFHHDSKCLIEAGISGREIECAVLGLHGKARVALPGEIIPSPKIGWYSFEAKYLLTDGAQTVIPAELPGKTRNAIQEFAVKAFDLVEADGLARVDLFLEHKTNTLYLNEINTLPGFTPISMYPKMWQASGVAYQDLVSELIELAFQRAS